MKGVIELDFDLPNNNNVWFPPLGMYLRGRWELHRVHEPAAMQEEGTLGKSYPSQRLRLDLETGEGQVIDPLYDDEHRDTRLAIEQKQKKHLPKIMDKAKAHVPTWLFWMKNLVDQKLANKRRGEFPDKIDGKPNLSQFSQEDGRDKEISELRAQLAELRGMVIAFTQTQSANGQPAAGGQQQKPKP